jgi:tetratricopeptide (TPR) repeat protein
VLGDLDRALASGQRAFRIAEAIGDFSSQVRANFGLGVVHYSLGDYRQALDFLGRNVVALTGEFLYQRHGGAGFNSVASRTFLVWCQAELGLFAEGVTRGDEGVRIAETVDHSFSLIQAYAGIGLLYLRKGDLHQAITTLERGLSVHQAWPTPLMFPVLASALGLAYALEGRSPEALPLLEQAVEQAAAMRIVYDQPQWLASLSEAYLLAGRLEEASDIVGRALDLARVIKERGNQAHALRLLGEITAHAAPPQVEATAGHYHKALTLAEELGMRPLQAHCHRSLGTLYARTGQRQQARAALVAAIDLYRDMDMTFWLPQAEAALAQVESEP